ncbi:MAG: hypothetical protein NZ750_06265 [Anaerolineae bacterium]|nr:hypothetical protein [Anaerolineae bacterium]MDW8171688.1 hypothetical protein [Anaerolineae bacterium]
MRHVPARGFAWGLRQIVRERRKRAALKPTQQRREVDCVCL